jgi:hypothetical protein
MSTNQSDPKHFDSVVTIDARLAEIEHEKRALLARKESLLRLTPTDDSSLNLTPTKKIAIFRNLLRWASGYFRQPLAKPTRAGRLLCCL